MMKYKIILILFILQFAFLRNGNTQILINEYSGGNISTVADNYGQFEDWFELYNTTAAPVSISGFFLSDKASNPTKWQIPAGVTIPANGYQLVFCTNRDEFTGGFLHPNFKLTQTKPEEIVLSNSLGLVIDNLTIDPTKQDDSRGRTTDGSANWSLFLNPTPGAANNGANQDYVSRPVMSIQAGFYPAAINVSITCPDPGATIRYTTNGFTPNASSTVYSGPIAISNTTVLRAIAISSTPSTPPSFIESNTYFINENHSIAVISVFGDQVLDLLNGSYISPEASIEYFDKTQQYRTEATGITNKHGNDSWAYSQRGLDFVARDQFGYNYGLLYKIFNRKTRTEFQRIILKAAANDNYPFETGGAHIRDAYVSTLSQKGQLHLDERTYEPCILYANGQYWGVYEIREKVDDADFIDYYHNSNDKSIQMLKTWGSTWSEFGGPQAQTDWDNLKNFILSNNMANASNYHYADSLYSTKSLVDYFTLNAYVVCSDWLNWNTQWWRGINPNADKKKWRYTLWDEDATFGHYINYTGVPNTSPSADPCAPEQLMDPGGQGHTSILNALLANPTFKQYYIARFADLSNTIFSCPVMQSTLDSMIALIQPEMQRHINKWGGSTATWLQNVQSLKTFIDQRCTQIEQGMIDCYTLTGPYSVIVDVDPPNSGTVKINSINPPSYPWNCSYYGGMLTLLKATPAPGSGYSFDYWELNIDPVTPDSTKDSVSTSISANEIIIAHFKKEEAPKDTTSLIMPNVFTPNGDGFNDFFKPNIITKFTSASLEIYNRWGKLIFKTTDLQVGWDGKVKGKMSSDGVYYWILNYTDLDNAPKEMKGVLQLINNK